LVVVSFVIEKDGSVSNVKILKGVTPNLDEEAMRVVKKMPNWSPGTQRSRAVRVQINLPIRFTLTDSGKKDKKDKQ
jgi:TonB family protein